MARESLEGRLYFYEAQTATRFLEMITLLLQKLQ